MAQITRGNELEDIGNDVNSVVGERLVAREQRSEVAEGQSPVSLPGCGLGRRLSAWDDLSGGGS